MLTANDYSNILALIERANVSGKEAIGVATLIIKINETIKGMGGAPLAKEAGKAEAKTEPTKEKAKK